MARFFHLYYTVANSKCEQMNGSRSDSGTCHLFLIPVFEAPPPPPKNELVGDTNADEYTGNAGRECGVCRGRILVI